MVLFVFQFYSVCNFGKFINFGLGTVRSERINNKTNNKKTKNTNNSNKKENSNNNNNNKCIGRIV